MNFTEQQAYSITRLLSELKADSMIFADSKSGFFVRARMFEQTYELRTYKEAANFIEQFLA